MNSSQQQEYLNKYRQEVHTQMIQDLVTKISENCFKVNQFITIVLDRALYAIIA